MPMRRNLVQCSLVYDTTISNIYALNDTFNGSGNTGSFTGTVGTTLANPSGNELEVSSTTFYPVISATISTVSGKEYIVSADLNGMTVSGGYSGSVLCEIIEGGVTVASQSVSAPGNFNFNYTAGAGSASIRYTYVLTPNPGPPPPPPTAPFNFNLDNALVYYLDTNISSNTVCVSKNGYRYGFNGMEKVNEISGDGNDYDFGARIYDGRLGRWFSVDIEQYYYQSFSAYNFVLNNPIRLIDIDGKKFIDPFGNIIKVSFDANGNLVLKYKKMKSASYTDKLGLHVDDQMIQELYISMLSYMLNTLATTDGGKELIRATNDAKTRIFLVFGNAPNNDNAQTVPDKDKGAFSPFSKFQGFKEVTIYVDLDKLITKSKNNNCDLEELIGATLIVEFGHLSPDQFQLDQSNATPDEKYYSLWNKYVEFRYEYREAKKQDLSEDIFKLPANNTEFNIKLNEKNKAKYDEFLKKKEK